MTTTTASPLPVVAAPTSLLSRLAAWPALLIAALLYLPTVGYSWAADDHWYLVDKPWSVVPGMFNLLDTSRFFYRPLSALSYLLSYKLFGPNPAAWHAINLLWYLTCVYLCFLFARKLLGLEAAVLGSLFFAAHPAHPGAVAWVSSLSDVQAASFALLAAWAWLLYRERGRAGYYWLTSGAVVFALLSKEAAAALPLVLLVGDLLLGWRTRWRRRWWTLAQYVGLLLPLLVYFTLKSVALSNGGVVLYKLWFTSDPWQLLPSTLTYVLNSFGLPVYYLDGLGVALSLLLVVGLGLVSWRMGATACYLLAWVLLMLGPVVLNIKATNLTERTVFLPSVGSSLLLGLLLVTAYRKIAVQRPARWLLGAAVGGLLLLAVAGTIVHNYDWYQAGQINARIISDFRRLQPSVPADAIVYFRGVPYLYGNAYVVGNRGLNYMLRQPNGSLLRVIDKDFSPPDKYCLPGNTFYFAVAADGSVTKLADCQTWLEWRGEQPAR